jgi:shikimate dehydrogenase
MTDQYAVIGNPVAHSRSPAIHAEFARQTGEDVSYGTVLAALDGFSAAVRAFRDAGGRGLNVTLPFKHEAWQLSGRRSERSERARAVNTLSFQGEFIAGDNTDGAGLTRDIEGNLQFNMRGKRALLLGAGGAAWGVGLPLLAAGLASLTIANRTVSKALELRRSLAEFRTVDGCGYEALEGRAFDLVVNATSAGLSGAAPPLPVGIFAPGALAYEMVYGRTTQFMEFAHACRARVADGLGMLVEQAAESFFIWRGVRPDTAPVIRALRMKAEG